MLPSRLILLSFILVFLSFPIINNTAMSEDVYADFTCIAPSEKGILALERTECDEEAELYAFRHGVLRVLTPEDPVDPLREGCIYPEIAYVCLGVPSINPPIPSYVWISTP